MGENTGRQDVAAVHLQAAGKNRVKTGDRGPLPKVRITRPGASTGARTATAGAARPRSDGAAQPAWLARRACLERCPD